MSVKCLKDWPLITLIDAQLCCMICGKCLALVIKNVPLLGGRHSSADPSLPTILLAKVQVPSQHLCFSVLIGILL